MLLASLPTLATLLEVFRPCFTAPSYANFCVLAMGAILSPGRRTVTEALRATTGLAGKHFSTYHRFLSRAVWRPRVLARALVGLVASLVPAQDKLIMACDDTTERRNGSKVHAVACHRDAVRSTQKMVSFCFGHKWLVLAILVRLPFSSRPWALPVVVLLYRSAKDCEKRRLRHRTLEDLARIAVWLIRRWLPKRRLILVADGGYSSTGLGAFCHRLGVVLVSRLRNDAALYARPAPRVKGQRGRPAKKGERLLSPIQYVGRRGVKWSTHLVEWYGGKVQEVRWLSRIGLRVAPNEPALEIRWVLVNVAGTDRYECFQCTDPTLAPIQIIELYVLRWSIETTFEECRRHVGLETTRNWVQPAVERTVPCLFGLFSLITVWYVRHLEGQAPSLAHDPWYDKPEATFSDAIAQLRRLLWAGRISIKSTRRGDRTEIPTDLVDLLCERLARSA